MKTKVHKITLLVVDHDDLGARDVAQVLEDARYPNRCINPRIVETETREIEWSDDHPINLKGTWRDAVAELFPGQAEPE